MKGEHHSGEFPGSKGNQKTAARLHAVLQCLGKPVGKRVIQRHRQADVAVHHEYAYMKAVSMQPNCSAGARAVSIPLYNRQQILQNCSYS